jgi:hypothetical protein|nr:MAG TPA: protein of unknown function (DUF3127) [Caudoviricetes sp.]
MKCEATGRIIVELPSTRGTGNGKDWEKREYIMETNDARPKKMKFTMFSSEGPIADPLRVGDTVNVKFQVEAREYQGKWYNDVRAWQVQKLQ